MNQPSRRKLAIPTAQPLHEVCSFSMFSTAYLLYKIYYNYFNFDGKLLIKNSKNTGNLICFPGISTWRLACGWTLPQIYQRNS